MPVEAEKAMTPEEAEARVALLQSGMHALAELRRVREALRSTEVVYSAVVSVRDQTRWPGGRDLTEVFSLSGAIVKQTLQARAEELDRCILEAGIDIPEESEQ